MGTDKQLKDKIFLNCNFEIKQSIIELQSTVLRTSTIRAQLQRLTAYKKHHFFSDPKTFLMRRFIKQGLCFLYLGPYARMLSPVFLESS